MKKEIWKDIEGYEGLYQVSSYGRVRSADRIIEYNDGRKGLFKWRIKKTSKDSYGYLFCSLSKNSKLKVTKVHRLVAEAFILNPNHLPQINHKDEDKTNNHVSNLEWCDGKYNANYGTRNKRSAEKRLNSPKLSKPVLQLDISTGQVISEYSSAREASRQLNINPGGISACCRGKCKTYKGFRWKYK